MGLWIRYDSSRNIWEVSPNDTEHYFSDLLEHHPREVNFGRWVEFEGFADSKSQGALSQPEILEGSRRVRLYTDGDLDRTLRRRSGNVQSWGPAQVLTPPGVAPTNRGRIIFDKIDNRFKYSSNGSSWQDIFRLERGGILVNTNGITAAVNIIVWRAPYDCTVLAVKGYRVGGTGATINARKNGSSNHLSSNLSLSSADSWMDGGAVQNAVYAAGDKLEIMVVSVTGSPTQIGVQVDFVRP